VIACKQCQLARHFLLQLALQLASDPQTHSTDGSTTEHHTAVTRIRLLQLERRLPNLGANNRPRHTPQLTAAALSTHAGTSRFSQRLDTYTRLHT
jgi:hypothetical protein